MDKITIADSLFLSHTKSAFLGGDNVGIPPSYFEWEQDDPQTARFITDSDIKNARGEGQVAWLLEPFHLHPENYIEAIRKPFDYVLTSNLYFAQNNQNWLWYAHGGSWIDFSKWGMHEKTKNISMLMSDKNTMPGHKLRHKIAEEYEDKIDVLSNVSAFDGYAPYRYSIIIENEKSDGYFTEKLIDCLSVGTIPIYWGCPNSPNYFETQDWYLLEKLQEVFQYLNSASYKDSKGGIRENIELSKPYRIVENWIYREYPYLFKRK